MYEGSFAHQCCQKIWENFVFDVAPRTLNVSAIGTTATSISLSWTMENMVEAEYAVTWNATECHDDPSHGRATITTTSYIIEELRAGTVYNITVIATNMNSAQIDTVVVATLELCKYKVSIENNYRCNILLFSSIFCSKFCECFSSELLYCCCKVGTSEVCLSQWSDNRLSH